MHPREKKLLARSFCEVLSWHATSDPALGFLAEPETGPPKSLRCAIMPKVIAEEEAVSRAGSERGYFPVRTYVLVAWASQLQGIKTDQICNLTKIGEVRYVNHALTGEYARLAEITVEQI